MGFLKTINRITTSQLNYIYKEQTNQDEISTGLFRNEQPITGKLAIVLRNEIHISRIGLPASLVAFLKEELNFANNEYQVKRTSTKTHSV